VCSRREGASPVISVVLPLLPPTLEALNLTTKRFPIKDVFVAGRGGSRGILRRGGRRAFCSGLLLEARFASNLGSK
jgi:hypothetical protein